MTAGQARVLESAIPALERLENAIADSDAARRFSLGSVLPALEQLERALGEERARQATTLHTLVADERLQRLARLAHEQRHEFDALDFIGELRWGLGRRIWGPEDLHSNLLAWLLDPKQNHGLGDTFLKRFVRSAGAPPASSSVDWSATESIREWKNYVDDQWGLLDILIVNESERVLCAIEVKTFSDEHDEQLTRYRKALEIRYPAFTRYHVFLTRRGIKPYREEEKEYWQPLTYSTIRNILQQIVVSDDHAPNADVRAFLRQYATTLRRHLVPDTSVSQLAKRIWLEHREALELLIEHRPN